MQNESYRYNAKRNPFRLLSALADDKKSVVLPSPGQIDSIQQKALAKDKPSNSKLADRYTSEIASVSKMKEYENVVSKQREALMKENRTLREKFSEDVLEARKLERNVSVISQTISEFLQILQGQSETVADMHQAGKVATEQLKQVEQNLELTITRTETHSKTMVSIIFVMTLLILLLDYFAP
jgi:hypothetical protein